MSSHSHNDGHAPSTTKSTSHSSNANPSSDCPLGPTRPALAHPRLSRFERHETPSSSTLSNISTPGFPEGRYAVSAFFDPDALKSFRSALAQADEPVQPSDTDKKDDTSKEGKNLQHLKYLANNPTTALPTLRALNPSLRGYVSPTRPSAISPNFTPEPFVPLGRRVYYDIDEQGRPKYQPDPSRDAHLFNTKTDNLVHTRRAHLFNTNIANNLSPNKDNKDEDDGKKQPSHSHNGQSKGPNWSPSLKGGCGDDMGVGVVFCGLCCALCGCCDD